MPVSHPTTSLATALLMAALCGSCTRDEPPPAIRLDPVAAIIDALESHQIVALGDMHHNLQLHELRLDLLRDPRLPDVVDDIVVEFGASQHQAIIDGYVNGEAVPYDVLRTVWLEAPSLVDPLGWDRHDTFEFYRTVREVNASLPEGQRLRVVLGDGGYETMEGEAWHIMRQVTDLGRSALVIFGAGHLNRRPLWYPISDQEWMAYWFEHPDSVSTVSHLEAAGISVFSLKPLASDPFIAVQPDIEDWAMPSITVVEGTRLGLEPFATFEGFGAEDDVGGLVVPDEEGGGFHVERVAPDPERSGLLQEQFDGVVILGAAAELSQADAPDGAFAPEDFEMEVIRRFGRDAEN